MAMWIVVASWTASLLLVSIAHELGHLLVAQRLGIPVKRVAVGFGPVLWRRTVGQDMELALRAIPVGMAVAVPVRRTASGQSTRPVEHDILMAAGGPLASLMLALICGIGFLALDASAPMQIWLISTALLSIVLMLLNLIPIPGLDGGHLLLLIAARFGWELDPHQESAAHRAGLRVTVGVSMLLVVLAAVRTF